MPTGSLLQIHRSYVHIHWIAAEHRYSRGFELDAAYSGRSIDSPDQADESQELTYVDIDTFLESF